MRVTQDYLQFELEKEGPHSYYLSSSGSDFSNLDEGQKFVLSGEYLNSAKQVRKAVQSALKNHGKEYAKIIIKGKKKKTMSGKVKDNLREMVRLHNVRVDKACRADLVSFAAA